ncbi:hypothetical protein JTB14_025815 [Gonioctena quinquepunctata]|nr:hypothetical protein JTB14_025815 [Gonioctena quinquepunctata]
MYSTIPLNWFPFYVKVFLLAADKYDLLLTPHLVLLKAISHVAYLKYGPQIDSWTRTKTKDLSFKTVRRKFARYRHVSGGSWKLMGTLEPPQIIDAIECTRHSGISIFNSVSNEIVVEGNEPKGDLPDKGNPVAEKIETLQIESEGPAPHVGKDADEENKSKREQPKLEFQQQENQIVDTQTTPESGEGRENIPESPGSAYCDCNSRAEETPKKEET